MTLEKAAPEAAISIQGLAAGFNGHTVLEQVDLAVGRGEFLVVLGPNGGGKTTLLKAVLGMVKPLAGSVRVFGLHPAKARPRMGYMPQYSTGSRGFPISVLDAVLTGLVVPGSRGFRFSALEKERAMAALEQVELARHATKRLGGLSGGQRQRALIARALVGDPDILLLDEPTANIDPHGKFCFFDFLSTLAGERTVVAVSHDLSIASARADSLACVNRRLMYNPRAELTREMLSLMYGSHEHPCPMDEFMAQWQQGLPARRGEEA